MDLIKKLTGKNPAEYEAVAKSLVDNSDVALFAKLVKQDDFLFDFVRRRGNDFNSLLPFHHVSLKVILPSGKARHKGSVRLLHGDKDGVSEAVIMEF